MGCAFPISCLYWPCHLVPKHPPAIHELMSPTSAPLSPLLGHPMLGWENCTYKILVVLVLLFLLPTHSFDLWVFLPTLQSFSYRWTYNCSYVQKFLNNVVIYLVEIKEELLPENHIIH